ncbi:MAG: cyclic lactone autoinducer peptide [bacterium LCO1.1]|uniref:Cyclic lactone autoinducer peptide n=1 Tax=Candidatus Weimeria bifida TaxID=2599074 RepID=A0A6N7IYN2_9FIRM|nr:cyclic lactone autoinducer peptide [Candidatus Weimeria bifida]
MALATICGWFAHQPKRPDGVRNIRPKIQP